MSRLLCLAELHRRDDAAARSHDWTGGSLLDRTSPFTESNRRPSPYPGDALPTELKGRAPLRRRPHQAAVRALRPPPRPRPTRITAPPGGPPPRLPPSPPG